MKPQAVGALNEVSSEHPDIQRAVSFFLSKNRLSSPVSSVNGASIQLVAGYKYRFNLKLEDGSHYRIIIFENLSKEMSESHIEKL